MLLKPRFIRLDAATVCQLKCPSCPTASGETGERLGAGFLKFSDFKGIVDQNPHISHIELSNWGELFLNKDLLSIMRYAYRHNVALSALNGGNLNNISSEVLEGMVKYKFRALTCSIDGASQEVYSIYRVRGNFDQVMENIKTINRFKAKYKSDYPDLQWQYIAFGHNEKDISGARKLAADLNMTFKLKLSWDDLYDKPFSPIKNKELIKRETGGVATRKDFKEKFNREYATNISCVRMWNNPQVNYDGRLLGCCINYWDDYGNVFKDGVVDTHNNDKMNYARAMLMGKKEPRKDVACTKCKIYHAMRKTNAWVTDKDIQDSYAKSRMYLMLEEKILGRGFTEKLARIWGAFRRSLKKKESGLHTKKEKLNQPTLLKSGVFPLAIPLEPDNVTGFKPYSLFKGFTEGLKQMASHISVLNEYRLAHLPFGHKEEELLILLSGEADLIWPDLTETNINHRQSLKTGQFVYYPAFVPHTIQTTSQEPANYLMFKWYASPKKCEEALKRGVYDFAKALRANAVENGFKAKVIFESPTNCLKKLRCHVSTLTPKGGYEPHADEYDVAIVVLEGEVETLGKRVSPHGVIFYKAGEPHGMFNPGEKEAKYLVFEFHPHKKFLGRTINRVMSRIRG